MKKLFFVAVLATVLLSTSGMMSGPHAFARSQKFFHRENAIPNRYIVVLDESKAGFDLVAPTVESNANYLSSIYGGSVEQIYASAIKGYVSTMNPKQAESLSDDPSVLFVEEDSEISIASSELNAPWGLDRIDQRNIPWDGMYNYTNTGSGVNAYIIDTGIRPTHVDFGGRASADFDNVGDGQNGIDCNGHGTHVAGIIGSATYGVAKGVRLHGVRVIPCNGNGQISNLIAGIDWVTAHAVHPAVANISLAAAGGSPSLEASVTNAINSGISFAVAAGNGNYDACNFTPARTPLALTVGASDETDLRALYSNWGTCVDVFAPGNRIDSTWASSDTAVANLSGSSMAAPMVAGVAALYLEAHPTASAASVSSAILSTATSGVLDVLDTPSPNKLLYTFVNGAPAPTPTPTATPMPTATPTPSPTPSSNKVRVTVKKRAQGAITQDTTTASFPYSAVNMSTSSFVLQTNQDFVDPNAEPGSVSNPIVVQESSVDGWQLMSISCVDPTGAQVNSSVDLTSHKVSMVGNPGQQIECTFTSQQLGPTAAGAVLSGRVLDLFGIGVGGIKVYLGDPQTGAMRYTRTNMFGYYSFDEVGVGHAYRLGVVAGKRWSVPSPMVVVVPNADIGNINFIAEEGN